MPTYTPTVTSTPTYTEVTTVKFTPTTIPYETVPTTAPTSVTTPVTTPEICKENYQEIGDDAQFFGPRANESSSQTLPNVFKSTEEEIVITLKFNAYQVDDADIETVIFNVKNVVFKSSEVVTEEPNSRTFSVSVSTSSQTAELSQSQ